MTVLSTRPARPHLPTSSSRSPGLSATMQAQPLAIASLTALVRRSVGSVDIRLLGGGKDDGHARAADPG